MIYTGKNISGASDLPPGTYQIPDSQVFISGHQSATKSPASMMFGLVGVLVANQMDKNKGETAVTSSSGSRHRGSTSMRKRAWGNYSLRMSSKIISLRRRCAAILSSTYAAASC